MVNYIFLDPEAKIIDSIKSGKCGSLNELKEEIISIGRFIGQGSLYDNRPIESLNHANSLLLEEINQINQHKFNTEFINFILKLWRKGRGPILLLYDFHEYSKLSEQIKSFTILKFRSGLGMLFNKSSGVHRFPFLTEDREMINNHLVDIMIRMLQEQNGCIELMPSNFVTIFEQMKENLKKE